ncbi:sulfurtransferase [Aggregicoccus sp. 17bor-14]|uniref:sulfurtransferase n=1 Tax=Myxococcaceae TaxID=31 RepID=UPI00129CB61F|nr:MULTISPECIES: sulfurtransferase [Myxococcaceae]MBF5042199.1 sulfurtransferase [Simulacricoccus sp. 17bor-14]MRI87975.1 sulfurtransferase [Aggregicoccus sp. 17bor-14]
MPWTTLVDVDSLARALNAPHERPLALVDARVNLKDRSAGARLFAEGHIPGAVRVELETDLSGPHFPGAGRHPWPEGAAFAAVLGRLGITPRHQVVVYDDAQGALAAARLWFMLRAWGHPAVAVLDGGWSAWTASGGPVEKGEARVQDVGPYSGAFEPARLLHTAELEPALRRGGTLIDARAAERYRGETEPLDRKAGHIPGALNRPFALNLESGRFKPAAALRAELELLLKGRAPESVIASCGSGVTACHHLLAMEHAGLHGARLYTGSWSGWIEDDARPIATG